MGAVADRTRRGDSTDYLGLGFVDVWISLNQKKRGTQATKTRSPVFFYFVPCSGEETKWSISQITLGLRLPDRRIPPLERSSRFVGACFQAYLLGSRSAKAAPGRISGHYRKIPPQAENLESPGKQAKLKRDDLLRGGLIVNDTDKG